MDAPRIKLCGVTSLEDAHLCAEAGAWALGMIFSPDSPRRCTVATAEEIGGVLRRRLELVGVFVNAPLEVVTRTAERAALSIVQLHGDEGPSYAAEVARRTGAKVMKAMRVRTRGDLQALEAFRTDLHLVDAHVPGLRGGTGQTMDWRLLTGRRPGPPLVLAGGLNPDNVAAALAAVRPYAVDSASGTEAAPGVKDPVRVEAFVAAARGAAAGVEEAPRAARGPGTAPVPEGAA